MDLSSLFNASVIVAVFGAFILYFGKIMSDIDVEFHDKLDFYIIGAIFTSVWVIVPLFAIAYPLFTSTQSFTLSIWDSIVYFIPLLIAILLGVNIKENINLRKQGISPQTSNKLVIKLGNKFVLLFFSILAIVSAYYWYLSIETKFVLFVVFSIYTFFILTLIAMSYAYQKNEYPHVFIYLQNNPIPIKGIVLKYADFVYILENGKEVRINTDAIVKIEKT
jgi:hypothetical protein